MSEMNDQKPDGAEPVVPQTEAPQQEETLAVAAEQSPATSAYPVVDNAPPRSAIKNGPSTGTVILLAIIFGLLAGFAGTVLATWANQTGKFNMAGALHMNRPLSPNINIPVTDVSQERSVQVAAKLNESVVNIRTESVQDNPYSMFFGGSGSQTVTGIGTGVIIDTDGYILTNMHVVEGAKSIKVTVLSESGQQEYKGEFIAGDKQEDMAVVKIKADGLRPVIFGNSDALQVGQWAMAMGNPYGFEHTVSVGVVSALNRQLPTEDGKTMKGLVQTDASINPGNSGGPLVNINGEVIGINTAVYVGGNGQVQARGIGFAIPSNRAKKIMEMLRDKKRIEHPYIGIKYIPNNDDVRAQFHLPTSDGVLVQEVVKGGPADKAQIKSQDIITTVDGQKLNTKDILGDIVAKLPVGKVVDVVLQRDNNGKWEEQKVKLTVGDMPAATPEEATPQPAPQRRIIPNFPF